MIKVDLYTSNFCSSCVAAKARLSHVINVLNTDKVELTFVDVVDHIDAAVALGILATPAIVIENTLVFTSLPAEKILQAELEKRLKS